MSCLQNPPATARRALALLLLAIALPSLEAARAADDAPADTGGSAVLAPEGGPIFGILDAGVRHVGQVSSAGSLTQFASGLNTSRVGIRGSEDIGDGIQASLRLVAGLNPGTGVQSNSGALFDRTADVGLRVHETQLRFGRQEGFGYELAAAGATDPISMALNVPDYASPAAAGSKAPVLGANPLQAVYSYTYGQLRFNNVLRAETTGNPWSAGVQYSVGGVASQATADSLRAAHLGWSAAPLRADALVQQTRDIRDRLSTLYVLAGSYEHAAWKFQAGVHRLDIDAGFDSSTLGNGASSSGILGTSTTVSPVLASPTQDFRLRVLDAGATWTVVPGRVLTLAAYRTTTDGLAAGQNNTVVGLGKWYLAPRVALYLAIDHATSTGQLAVKTVSGTTVENATSAGINVRF